MADSRLPAVALYAPVADVAVNGGRHPLMVSPPLRGLDRQLAVQGGLYHFPYPLLAQALVRLGESGVTGG